MSNPQDIDCRFDELEMMILQHRIIRHSWTGKDKDGLELACLLAAISPEVGSSQSASYCPSTVLPKWLAQLTPWMDDRGTADAWPAFIRRYASVVRNAAKTLDADGWRCAEYACKSSIVRESMRYTKNERALAICERVAVLCDNVSDGAQVDRIKFASAAAHAASYAVCDAAWAAAASYVAAAAYAVTSYASAYAASDAHSNALAVDRMSTAILDAIENEANKGNKYE